MRWTALPFMVALLTGCPKIPYCHCDLPDQCAEIKEDCAEANISCNVEHAMTPGLDGKCSVRTDAVGSCAVDESITIYYYASGYTSDAAHADCKGHFTPLPADQEKLATDSS